MTPRERAEAIMATPDRPNCHNEQWWVEQIAAAASNEELERALAPQQVSLKAALESLRQSQSALLAEQAAHEATKRERDALEAELAGVRLADAKAVLQVAMKDLAAHERQVAARVLRKVAANESLRFGDWVEPELLLMEADAYERGEREVPSVGS